MTNIGPGLRKSAAAFLLAAAANTTEAARVLRQNTDPTFTNPTGIFTGPDNHTKHKIPTAAIATLFWALVAGLLIYLNRKKIGECLGNCLEDRRASRNPPQQPTDPDRAAHEQGNTDPNIMPIFVVNPDNEIQLANFPPTTSTVAE